MILVGGVNCGFIFFIDVEMVTGVKSWVIARRNDLSGRKGNSCGVEAVKKLVEAIEDQKRRRIESVYCQGMASCTVGEEKGMGKA